VAKNEKTSPKAGKAASKVLKDCRTGKSSKTAAGSALTQRPKHFADISINEGGLAEGIVKFPRALA